MRCFASIFALLSIAAFAETMPPPEYQKLAREIYKQLIEINTSYSTGKTTPAAEAVAARLKAEGFPASDIIVAGAADHKKNVIVRYRGTGAKRPLLLLAHLDVVEAKPSDWSMDPFILNEKDGYFYGRGTADDKAQAAIWVANLIRYRREGFKPDRDLIVALTADEEGGGPYNGADWLVKNHREWIDAEYCLNEGGWGEMAKGKHLSNDIQVSEKYVANYRFEVTNPGGHSSMPVADNAIYHLAGAITRLSQYKFPIMLNDVTRAYFEQAAKVAPPETAALMTDLLKEIPTGSTAAAEKLAASSPAFNATLRTTCVATMLDGGHALNALPQTAGAMVNCRVMPEMKKEDVLATLKRVVADDQVKVTQQGDVPISPASPMRTDLMKAVAKLTDTMWPGTVTIPIMVMGGTDGRYLRSQGIPTYGVQGIFMDRDDMRMHGRDERMSVKSFYEGEAFLYELVKILAK